MFALNLNNTKRKKYLNDLCEIHDKVVDNARFMCYSHNGKNKTNKMVEGDEQNVDFLIIGSHRAAAALRVCKALGYDGVRLEDDGTMGGELRRILHRDAQKSPRLICLFAAEIGDCAALMQQLRRQSEALLCVNCSGVDCVTIDGLLPHADMLVINERNAAQFGVSAQTVLQRCAAGGPQSVYLTQGSAGAASFENDRVAQVRSIALAAADDTDAGAYFQGALLFCELRRMLQDETLRLCNTLAGMMCEQTGSEKRAPSEDEILARMAREMI